MKLNQLYSLLVCKFSLILSLGIICITIPSSAQELRSLNELEHLLKKTGKRILSDSTDESRERASIEFRSLLREALEDVDSYDYMFDSVTNLNRTYAPDDNFKLYCWVLPKVDNSEVKYFGFVQYRNKKNLVLEELKDKAEDLEEPDQKRLNSYNWYGALYYKIIPNKVNGKMVYTLLGWRQKGNKTTQKIVEILTLRDGKIGFGTPIIKVEKHYKTRFIMEYNSNVYAMLKYIEDKEMLKLAIPTESYINSNTGNMKDAMKNDPRKNTEKTQKEITYKKIKTGMIVMDHVGPLRKEFTGNYSEYGPDFSYDGLLFENEKWIFYPSVDIRSKELPVEVPKEKDSKALRSIVPPNPNVSPKK